MKKLLTRLALLMILCAALALPVFADAVTDSISVCIGYFGWSEDEYVEKAKFSWQELDDWYGGALDTHEEYYSYCNGSGRTYLAFARGFYIRDLLDYAGVDVNSIASIDFFTKDHSVGAYRSFTKYALLDQPRYYFPNLAGDAETGELYAWDGGDDLWVGAYQVEPMLALEDYTEWDTAGFDFESYADESLFSTGSRFHLFFGQASPEEAATSSAAKYVYKILVTFSGMPVLSSEESNLDLVVGSDHALHVTADAEDDALPALMETLRTASDRETAVEESGLLRRQKDALLELLRHPDFTDATREALAIELLEREQDRYDSIVKLSELLARLAPMLGLLGTLIPLGPGIIALGQGDTYTLSTSLLTAFDTAIAGLVAAALAIVVSAIRRRWYREYGSVLEALCTEVLELTKKGEAR